MGVINKQIDIKSKGTDRIQINNILAAACITILSVLLGLSKQIFNTWMVIQLSIATPLLVTSSMAYAKLSYRNKKELVVWDILGWSTLSLGYILLINSLAIMLHTSGYTSESWWFIGTVFMIFGVYSVIDVILDKKRLKEKSWKLLFYYLFLFIGAIWPLINIK